MDTEKNRPLVKFRRAAILYPLLLLFALIFTQALRSPASALLFWFLFLLPVVSVLYVLIGKALIRTYVSSENTSVEKLQPVSYELRIINASPFPYPFVEAVVRVPSPDGVRSTEQSLFMSLVPMGIYAADNETSFRYRGQYEIGVRCLYISDFLGLFSLRLDVDIYQNVTVYPRRLGMDMQLPTSATDIPNDAPKLVISTEKAEISNIREYLPGDSLKSIHWKLSSKSADGGLMVKDFNTNTSQSVYILCDFSRAVPAEVFEDEQARLELEKAEREASRYPKEKRVKLKAAKPDAEAKKALAAAKKAEKRSKAGMDAKKVNTAAMIDELIDTAAVSKAGEAPKRRKFALPFLKNRAKTPAEDPETIAAHAVENERRRREAETQAALAVGGIVKPEYAAEMDETCADGVVELSIAAVLNELRCGHEVTLIWSDKRQDGGIASVVLTCPEDFDAVYPVFSSAPSCSEKDGVASLLPLITESLNVTIRICTSNLDPLSLNRYGAIPGLFGGAGTGCVCEVLLFNPEDRYEDVKIRREYVEMSRIRLAQDGVDLTELAAVADEADQITLQRASH